MLRRLTAVVAVLVGVGLLPAVASAGGEGVFAPGAPGLGDPYFPLDGNGGYDVKQYSLNLRYSPDTGVLRGVASIKARATQDLSQFDLDLVGLNVRSIRVNGRAATWTRDGQELTVVPQQGVRSGARMLVRVAYDGVPQTLEEFGGPAGFIRTDDGALVAGQPHGAAYWFPVNDHPLDKAAYWFNVTVPKGLEVVANGRLQRHRTRGSRTTWTWWAREPMASYLATIAVGEFDIHAYEADGIRFWDAIDPKLFAAREQPRTGRQFAYSGWAESSYKRLARTVAVPAGGGRLSFWIDRDTEPNWDFVFVEAHVVGSDDWTTLPDLNGHTSQDTGFACPFGGILDLHPFLAHYETLNEDGNCSPTGTTGDWWAASGRSGGYEQWAVDLTPYAGQTVELSISYASDQSVQYTGVFVDDVSGPDGASTSFEDGLDGWTAPGAPEGSPGNTNDWTAGTAEIAPPPVGEAIRASLNRQPEILRFLSGVFGPYPFSTAGGTVDAVYDLGFALETQTRPVYAPAFWLDRDDPSGGDSVVVHELAHQWTGDYLAVARWRDIWLNEGFATYTEWLWSEREGRETPQQLFENFAMIPEDDPFWQLTIGDPGPEQLFDGPVYVRGAMTLQALRNRIGDETFFRLLKEWIRRNAGGNVTTEQFIALAEELSGQQLDDLFQTWLFTASKPEGIEPAATALRAAGARGAAVSSAKLPHLRR